jgi:hypothetical protein
VISDSLVMMLPGATAREIVGVSPELLYFPTYDDGANGAAGDGCLFLQVHITSTNYK